MGDIIDMLQADHRQLHRIFDTVESGDVTAIPTMCHLLTSHTLVEEQCFYSAIAARGDAGEFLTHALADHHAMRDLVTSLEGARDLDHAYLAAAGHLTAMARAHIDEEERDLLPRARVLLGEAERNALARTAQLVRTRVYSASESATSDGDGSWIQEPLTQDPTVDRSVEAAIERGSTAEKSGT